MNKVIYTQIRHRYGGSWKKVMLQNPEMATTLPTYDFVGGKVEKAQLIYVCGLGVLGSLGLPRFYKPEKSEKLSSNEIQSKTFKRLSVFSKDCKIRDIACGYGFTVIASRPSDSSHSAFGFGLNSHSQIGYHQSRPGYPLEIVATPSPIHVPTKSHIIKVSCGRSHSLLLAEDGSVFSLGNNSLGQCGRLVKEDEIYFGSKLVYKIKNLPSNITSLECGQDHSFFLTSDGQLFSCGWGADGQTGLGHYDVENKPTKVGGDISGVKIIKISSYADTVIALDNEGNVFGWGNTEYAQFRLLADAETEQFNAPRKLKLKNIPGKIVDIAAGGTMCTLLNDFGDVYVWGFGILGVGPKVQQSSIPIKIPESLFGRNIHNPEVKVVKIFAGLSHLAAINNLGELFMWGKNRGGCLGHAHGDDQYFPWRVDTNLASIKTVSLGVDHTCAIAVREFY